MSNENRFIPRSSRTDIQELCTSRPHEWYWVTFGGNKAGIGICKRCAYIEGGWVREKEGKQ